MSDSTPQPYDVAIASPARRALSRLPGRVAHAVIEFISGPLAENPRRLSKPLRNQLDGLHSARRGDYRILLRIDDDNRTVLIVDIDHRAHVYRT
ncbi:type II toxin-antitoxin system RelE/ParE family toxin [Gordonia sp. HNM0687]|uniref:Type II toxin-antitoxin system RelE/ParE family toxin n=1 Tax=Gordonia mangrovi TaxID=2665643 RepID=A0A6L7GK39_9ACTN|nr:type II toxin-antitoxin system RelE/ParE family toxin [Gordonia mangrovi]MXP20274.1 type II toxin-antitoxin system RelE/ParE family toxin [Gordonia mangrovi]UVF79122.1 type II toxin-antitoxin system RelE/ParE family toxin [Gordonia mangrovi]